jgi:hypothetical protein
MYLNAADLNLDCKDGSDEDLQICCSEEFDTYNDYVCKYRDLDL